MNLPYLTAAIESKLERLKTLFELTWEIKRGIRKFADLAFLQEVNLGWS